MDTKLFARIGAVIFIAIAITMTAIELARGPDPIREKAAATKRMTPSDPLLVELQRCQALGTAGGSDSNCLRAWAENRRRFLAPGARPMARIADGAAPQGN